MWLTSSGPRTYATTSESAPPQERRVRFACFTPLKLKLPRSSRKGRVSAYGAWSSFGYALGTIRGIVTDCCGHSDGTVLLARVVRGRSEHHVVDVHVHVEASSAHAVHNLLSLLHPLLAFRKIHRANEERSSPPRVSLGPGRFRKQELDHFGCLPAPSVPAGVAVLKM